VVEVLEDLVDRLTVLVADLRCVVRCSHCGFLTARVHDLAHGAGVGGEVGRDVLLVGGASRVNGRVPNGGPG